MDFIELDGVALRYELSGKDDRTLVLVHEMGGQLARIINVVCCLAPLFSEAAGPGLDLLANDGCGQPALQSPRRQGDERPPGGKARSRD